MTSLRDCSQEPIHTPGHIQPHGVLFALNEAFETTHISENAVTWLEGRTIEQLLGTSILNLVATSSVPDLRKHLLDPDLPNYNPLRATFGRGQFHLIGHRWARHIIVELEEIRAPRTFVSLSPYHLVRGAVAKMRHSRSLQDLCAVVANEVKSVTGFARVLVYKFTESWDGEVIVEERDDDVQSFADLRFPASDIPAQARQLYTHCTQRIIPDVNYKPVALRSLNAGVQLDLSLSVLRSVSPFHLQYMRNMGVKASMSVSIIKEGRLWGLISCADEKHEHPVPFDIRASCDFLSENMSLLIESKEAKDRAHVRQRANRQMSRLLRQMANSENFVDGLLQHDVNIAHLVSAGGAAVVYGSRIIRVGATPNEEQIRDLVHWLSKTQSSQIWSTNSLESEYPKAAHYRNVGCGIISGLLSLSRGEFILWFRPEVQQVIHWGGNPNKESQLRSGEISPRTSFERWTETVTKHSNSWKEAEKRTAGDLLRSVIDVVLQSSEELSALNAELERSNTELDAFAYAASHDLKEPLRGINNFTTLVLRNLDEACDTEDTRAKLQTVVRLTHRMEALIDALLRYSHLGRTDIEANPINLEQVVKNTLELLQLRVEEKNARIRVDGALPQVLGESTLIQEVFTNLFTNALKYNQSEVPTILVRAEMRKDAVMVSVQDNGIGIAEQHHQDIFKIFRRLHGRTSYGGGTGTGLTIASRIIERHGGELWVDSTLGQGSTFHFSLKAC